MLPLIAGAQLGQDGKYWDQNSVGFGCGYSGSASRPVSRVLHYFQNRNYKKIKEGLTSELPADRFLAVVLLEKLHARNELPLTQEEMRTMDTIRKSEIRVPVCSGCTYWNEEPMNQLLSPSHPIYVSAGYWFDHYYDKENR